MSFRILTKNRLGFTLIELSIVIIIIGLIVAGTISGQILIKESKLKKIVSDTDKYQVALNTFKLKYNAIPGDMSNASSYWPTANNGDGNNHLAQWVAEIPGYWHHLSLSNIISNSYNGALGVPANTGTPGLNYPAGPLPNSLYSVANIMYGMPTAAARLTLNGIPYIDAGMGASGTYILTPAEAKSIDLKMDDGLPISGRVKFYSSSYDASGCSSSQVNTATFNLSLTTKLCNFSFDMWN